MQTCDVSFECQGAIAVPTTHSLNLLQHSRRHQLLLNMPLQRLNQKLSQIASLLLRPGRSGKAFQGRAKHLSGLSTRVRRYFGRSQTLVVGAQQAIGQGIKKSPVAIQGTSTNDALGNLGEI